MLNKNFRIIWFLITIVMFYRPPLQAQSLTEEIVPVIKLSSSAEHLPKKNPGDILIKEPFIGDLVVMYARDMPTQYEYVTEADRRRLDLSPEKLRTEAVFNLVKRLESLEVAPFNDFHSDLEGKISWLKLFDSRIVGSTVLERSGELSPSVLLLDQVWDDAFVPGLEGELVVAIPLYGEILFIDDAEPHTVRDLRKYVERVHREKTEKNLFTKVLLVRKDKKWQLYEK